MIKILTIPLAHVSSVAGQPEGGLVELFDSCVEDKSAAEGSWLKAHPPFWIWNGRSAAQNLRGQSVELVCVC